MALGKSDYYNYIKSPQWQAKRKQYYSSKLYKTLKQNNKGWVCYCCGATDKQLDLHHRTYKRLGNENIAVDLVPVCRDCHHSIHELHKNSPVSLWTATKKIRARHNKRKRKESQGLQGKKSPTKKDMIMKQKLNNEKRKSRLEKFKESLGAPENKKLEKRV